MDMTLQLYLYDQCGARFKCFNDFANVGAAGTATAIGEFNHSLRSRYRYVSYEQYILTTPVECSIKCSRDGSVFFHNFVDGDKYQRFKPPVIFEKEFKVDYDNQNVAATVLTIDTYGFYITASKLKRALAIIRRFMERGPIIMGVPDRGISRGREYTGADIEGLPPCCKAAISGLKGGR